MSEFIRNLKRIIPGRTTDRVLIAVIALWVAAIVGLLIAIL